MLRRKWTARSKVGQVSNENQVASELTDAFVTASRALVGIAVRSIESAPTRVTVPQHRVLVLLGAEGGLTVGDIAEMAGVNQSNASRLCDRLQKLGLVQRRGAPEDGRVVRVSLTRAGKEVLDVVTEHRRREVAAVLDRVPARRAKSIIAALRTFNDAAHERDDHVWAVASW